MNIRLYALSTCPYCRMTKRYLDEHGITYDLTEVDMLEGATDDPSTPKGAAVAEVKKLSGGTSFPVLVADGEVIVGFNKSRIASVLGL